MDKAQGFIRAYLGKPPDMENAKTLVKVICELFNSDYPSNLGQVFSSFGLNAAEDKENFYALVALTKNENFKFLVVLLFTRSCMQILYSVYIAVAGGSKHTFEGFTRWISEVIDNGPLAAQVKAEINKNSSRYKEYCSELDKNYEINCIAVFNYTQLRVEEKLLLMGKKFIKSVKNSGIDIEQCKIKYIQQIKNIFVQDKESSLTEKAYYLYGAFILYRYPNITGNAADIQNEFSTWLTQNIEISEKNVKDIVDTNSKDSLDLKVFLSAITQKAEAALINSMQKMKDDTRLLTEIANKTVHVIKDMVIPKFRDCKLTINDLEGDFKSELEKIQTECLNALPKEGTLARTSYDLESLFFYTDFEEENFNKILSFYKQASLFGTALEFLKLGPDERPSAMFFLQLESQSVGVNLKPLSSDEFKALHTYYEARNELVKKHIDVVRKKFPQLNKLSDDEVCKKIIFGERADNALLAVQACGKPFGIEKTPGAFLITYHRACEIAGIDDKTHELYPGYWQDLQPYLLNYRLQVGNTSIMLVIGSRNVSYPALRVIQHLFSEPGEEIIFQQTITDNVLTAAEADYGIWQTQIHHEQKIILNDNALTFIEKVQASIPKVEASIPKVEAKDFAIMCKGIDEQQFCILFLEGVYYKFEPGFGGGNNFKFSKITEQDTISVSEYWIIGRNDLPSSITPQAIRRVGSSNSVHSNYSRFFSQDE
ncbi:MAG: hypothetical protein V4591_00315 [Bdellovibrionota bacterium]